MATSALCKDNGNWKFTMTQHRQELLIFWGIPVKIGTCNQMWSFETANMKSTNWQVSRVAQGLKDLALQFATVKGNGLRQYQEEVIAVFISNYERKKAFSRKRSHCNLVQHTCWNVISIVMHLPNLVKHINFHQCFCQIVHSLKESTTPQKQGWTLEHLITIRCAATPIVSKVSDPNLHTQWDHQETLLSEIIIRLGKAWVELDTPFSTSQSREAERLKQIKLIDNIKDRSCVRVVLHLNNYPSPLSLRKPSSIISCYTTSANSTSSQESTT